jgi:hypothetical protein
MLNDVGGLITFLVGLSLLTVLVCCAIVFWPITIIIIIILILLRYR